MEKSVHETMCSMRPESLWKWQKQNQKKKIEIGTSSCSLSLSPLDREGGGVWVASSSRWSNNNLHRLWCWCCSALLLLYLVHDNFLLPLRSIVPSSLSLHRWILSTETEIVSNNFTIHIFHFIFYFSCVFCLVLRLLSFRIFVSVRRGSDNDGTLVVFFFFFEFFFGVRRARVTSYFVRWFVWFSYSVRAASSYNNKSHYNVQLVVFLLARTPTRPLLLFLSIQRLILFVADTVRFGNVFGRLMCCWLLHCRLCCCRGSGSIS